MSCGKCSTNKTDFQTIQTSSNLKDKYILVGSPNVGKSTFFTRVTWSTATIGNVDGITVQVQKGNLRSNKNITLVDLPGIRDLSATTKDEEVVIKNLLKEDYNSVLNIVAAPTLKRDLLITLQLLEAGILKEVVINMIDELGNKKINTFNLSKSLGVPINLAIARKNVGLKQSINCLLTNGYLKPFKINYGKDIEQIIEEISLSIPTLKLSKRFLAIQYLVNNVQIVELFKKWKIDIKINEILNKYNLDSQTIKETIYFAKKNKIESILETCFEQEIEKNEAYDLSLEKATNISNEIIQNIPINEVKFIKNTKYFNNNLKQNKKLAKSKKIDKFFFNKWIAIPLFLLLVAGVYYLCFGGYAGAWIVDQFTGGMELGVEKLGDVMKASGATSWAVAFVTEGLFGGIITTLGFLPYILFLHVSMSILEQTGLMARVSVIIDKSFEKYGLSGRSIITLMTGIGCSIPSVLMARNSHSQKERFITTLIAPLIACSARIVVFNWIGDAIVGSNFAWLLTLGLTIFSGLIALSVGWAFSNILFRSRQTFLLTELPPWRKPDILAILKSSGNELWQFIKRVFTIIFVTNIIMFLLTYIGPIAGAIEPPSDGESITNPNLDPKNTSFLGYISYGLKYLAYPIGLSEDWRLFASLLASAPAKEIAASNLELLFGNQQGFHDALFNSNITHLPVATVASYLIFFTFFTPCLSTDIVIKKEVGTKLLIIELVSSLLVAYGMSAIVFNGFAFVELLITNPILIKNIVLIISLILIIAFLIFNTFMIVYKKIKVDNNFEKYKKYNQIWIIANSSSLSLFVILTTTAYSLYT